MCDLTEVDYQKGDVVWVKLGSLWWPGMVHDYEDLPEDIKADHQAFKKKPLAYIKFFQEDNYEYVKDIHSIYQYNCLKKNEFIKKGLDMMRSSRVSTSNMQLFPGDIITAENLTNGDPKILDRPEFKEDEEAAGKVVYEDLFASPHQKKLKKKKEAALLGGFLKMDPRRKHTVAKPSKNISQGRLLDLSEDAATKGYQSKDLIQPEASNGMIEKNFSCVECNYQCSRVNVMLLHYQGHARRFEHKVKYPTGFKRKKKSVNVSSGMKKMKLTNGLEEKRGKSNVEVKEMQKKEAEQMKQNFLMDWDDEENEEDEKSDQSGEKSSFNEKEEEKASCFDFDDEEVDTSVSFSNRKRYSKTEEKELTNGKVQLEDEVNALLSETRMPSLPDVPLNKGGDAITLPPPNDAVSGFGTLNSDLNESVDFRTDIVSKAASTPATTKLSKQTLKTNYFKKVREEIAETAKFEEEEKEEDELEDEDVENDADSKPGDVAMKVTKVDNKPKSVEKNNVVASAAVKTLKVSPVKLDVVKKDKLSVHLQEKPKPAENIFSTEVKTVSTEVKTVSAAGNKVPTTVLKSPSKPIVNAAIKQNMAKPTAQLSPSKVEVQKIELPGEKFDTESIEIKSVDSKPVEAKQVDKVSDKPNVVRIGNQTIHIPVRRDSKDGRKSGEMQRKTENDRLAKMVLAEEVDVRNKFTPVKQQPSTTVHIDMSPREKISFTIGKQKTLPKSLPTILPIERMTPKFKSINIPSSSTVTKGTSVKLSPAKANEEQFYVLPNNNIIKTPTKSPAKSPVVLSTEKDKSHQSQVVFVPPGSKNAPKPSNVPLITMKSQVKKPPLPGLMKINTSTPSSKPLVRTQTISSTAKPPSSSPLAKPQSTLQSKIKHIASSNSAAKEAGKTGQGSILVNQNTLPSILQQRRSTQPVRAQPPTLVTTPKVIEEAELLSEISSIPGVDSSDAVVYLINNEQSQQVLCPPTTPASSSESQTIFIDPNSTDLSNIYLTIDDDGNILNIVHKTDEEPSPHSDILAKALADTQVLQAECMVTGTADTYQPIVNNTYETSLTLNQAPIMATSEAPTHVQQTFYTNSTAGVPLLEINPGQDNIVGMASPEIGYAPNDIIRT